MLKAFTRQNERDQAMYPVYSPAFPRPYPDKRR